MNIGVTSSFRLDGKRLSFKKQLNKKQKFAKWKKFVKMLQITGKITPYEPEHWKSKMKLLRKYKMDKEDFAL